MNGELKHELAEANKLKTELERVEVAIATAKRESESAAQQLAALRARRGSQIADEIAAGSERRDLAAAVSQEQAIAGRIVALGEAQIELERRSAAKAGAIAAARARISAALGAEVRERIANFEQRVAQEAARLKPLIAEALRIHAAAGHSNLTGQCDYLLHGPAALWHEKLEAPPAHEPASIQPAAAEWVPAELKDAVQIAIDLAATEKLLEARAGEIAQRDYDARRPDLGKDRGWPVDVYTSRPNEDPPRVYNVRGPGSHEAAGE